METKSRYNLVASILLFFSLVIATISACGVQSDISQQNLSSNLNPNPIPEPINDFPNILPNDFEAAACPTLAGFTKIRDLEVILDSDASKADTDGDGDDDAILLTYLNPSPNSLAFGIRSLTDTPIDSSEINLINTPTLIVGLMFDGSGNRFNPIFQVFGGNILVPQAWENLGDDPFLIQEYNPAEATVAPRPGGGTYSPWSNMNPGLENSFIPGVYVTGTYILDNSNNEHCAEFGWKIIICPYDGPIDDEGRTFSCN